MNTQQAAMPPSHRTGSAFLARAAGHARIGARASATEPYHLLVRFRTWVTLVVAGCFVVLNEGFMQVRIPPIGPGAPVAEGLIAVYILTLLLDLRFITSFAKAAPVAPLLLWWGIGVSHIIGGLPDYGFWAVRDGAHAIESTFLWIGFVVASRPGFLLRLERWLKLIFTLTIYITFTYPLRERLQAISPKVYSLSEAPTPIFFNYANFNAAVFTGLYRGLMRRFHKIHEMSQVLLACAAVAVVVLFFQQRTTYMQIVALVALLAATRPKALSRLGAAGLLAILLMAVVISLPLDLTGRLGDKVSFAFITEHIQAMWGGGDETVRASTAGVDLRLAWWKSIYVRVNASAYTAMFGLGFGMPLTSFFGEHGLVTREVHNSVVSVYGRMGLVGLICFLIIQARLFFTGLSLLRFLKRRGDVRSMTNMGSIVCFMVMCFTFALGEGAFETSYVSVPYYFLAGVLLASDGVLRRSAMIMDQQRASAAAKADHPRGEVG